MLAKRLKGRYGRLHHGNIAGSENDAQNLEDIVRVEREVSGCLLDHGGENLEGNLDISRNFHQLKVEAYNLQGESPHSPNFGPPDITGCFLLQKCAHLLDFTPPGRRIV